jgi:hypothetical protein
MEAVRKLRGCGGAGESDERDGGDVAMQQLGGGASPSPSRQARDCLPDSLPEDRLYYWQRMSSIVRIQKWWKQIFARRLIHVRAVQRRRELAEMLEGECAATIQSAWRKFHAKLEGQ